MLFKWLIINKQTRQMFIALPKTQRTCPMPSSYHNTDKTRLSSRRCEQNWRQVKTACRRQKISKLKMFSFFQFCPVSKCGVNTTCLQTRSYPGGTGRNCSVSKLRTTEICRQIYSHHGQEKTVLSCPCRWCELRIGHLRYRYDGSMAR